MIYLTITNLAANLAGKNVQELDGEPFEAIRDQAAIRIDKNKYIIVYKIDDFNLNNMYQEIQNFQSIEELDLQFFAADNFTYLIVKFESELKNISLQNNQEIFQEDYQAVLEQLESIPQLTQVTPGEFTDQLTNYLSNDLEIDNIEDLNKVTSQFSYQKDYIELEDQNKFFRLLKLGDYPNSLDFSKINADISINVVFKDENKTDKIYNSIEQNLQQKKRQAENEIFNPTYPYRLQDRLEKIEEVKNYNLMGIELKLLISAVSKEQLEEKTRQVKKIAYTADDPYNINILCHNHKKQVFMNYLPSNLKANYTPAFYKQDNICFFKNITTKSKDNLLPDFIKQYTDPAAKQVKNLIKSGLEKINLNPNFTKSYLPIKELYENGFFQLEDDSFSCIYQFDNINYLLEREEDKNQILARYRDFINVIGEEIEAQIYIKNKDINRTDLEADLHLSSKPGFEKYIKEYNQHLDTKIEEVYDTSSKTEYYLVINTQAETVKGAVDKVDQITNDIRTTFESIDSSLEKLTAEEIEKLFYESVSRPEKFNGFFSHDFQSSIAKKISPASFDVNSDTIERGRKLQKTFFIADYPNKMSDTFLSDLTQLPFSFEISFHISYLDPDQAIKKVKNKVVDMESNRHEKQDKSGSDYVPFDLEQDLEEGYYILDKLRNEDQNLYTGSFYITIFAEDEEELEAKEKSIKNVFSKHFFKYESLEFRQAEGFKSTLPFGVNATDQDYGLLTENLNYLHPFSYENVYHQNGIFYGLSNSDHPLVIDRKKYDNPSGFFLGVPGSGKSFATKMEAFNVFAQTDDDILIIDPEREYGDLTREMGGEVIKLSANADNYINVMEIHGEYTEAAIADKIEFLITFIEQLAGKQLEAADKSIIDRCLRKIYNKHKGRDKEPLLTNLYDLLLEQKEDRAEDLALTLEVFVKGSLDLFSQRSNCDTENRVVCYDIKDLRDQLKPPALTAVLDAISERLNKNRGIKNTWIYIDEIYLLFENESSSNWLFKTWKRIRKYWGVPTGITQNISDLLQSHTASTMLSNSEVKVVMKQAAEDRKILADFLEISGGQAEKITNCQAGTGLFMVENNTIPFENRVNPEQIPNLFDLIQTGQEEA